MVSCLIESDTKNEYHTKRGQSEGGEREGESEYESVSRTAMIVSH